MQDEGAMLGPRQGEAADLGRRFGGVARLYGSAALARFAAAHVCVIGVGGVGSWAVEALARSGIGALTLIDLDHLAESNINRQLPALGSTLGRAKVAVLGERARDINPSCCVSLVEDFIDPDNVAQLLAGGFDQVVDCIDGARAKAALIAHCRRQGLPLVTLGGAGGQVDPTRIRVTDLARSARDPLLARVRRLLREEHGFERGPGPDFGVPSVWSDEPPAPRPATADACRQPPAGHRDLSCAGGIGSVVTVTASFGLVACAQVLKRLAERVPERGQSAG